MFENICRICSSRGDYDIFSVIPSYLHSSSNEFLHWQKQINQLLEETTGLVVDKNDGLPQKMCALCISYLKHAATFRQQAIDNVLNLKAVLAYDKSQKRAICKTEGNDYDYDKDKASILVTADDLIFSEKRKTDVNGLVNNVLNNQTSGRMPAKSDDYFKKFLIFNSDGKRQKNDVNNQRNKMTNRDESESASEAKMQSEEALKTYMNLLFDKDTNAGRSPRKTRRTIAQHHRQNLDEMNTPMEAFGSDPLGDEFQTASSDDNEAYEQKKDFFNYKEKSFVEDDVMDLDELKDANIVINIPESCKERKCRACFRRFMFEDSYKEHMNICIEYKFLLLIEEINRLLDIRRSKAVSPHEFIRRMIFSLKKTCQWLKANCGEILLPDLLVNGDGKKRLQSEGKSSGAEISSGCKSDENSKEITVIERTVADNSLLSILKKKADSSFIRYVNKTPDPLLERLKSKEKFVTSTPEDDSKLLAAKLSENLRLSEDEAHLSAAVKLLSGKSGSTSETSFKRITTSSEDDDKLLKSENADSTTHAPNIFNLMNKLPKPVPIQSEKKQNCVRDLFNSVAPSQAQPSATQSTQLSEDHLVLDLLTKQNRTSNTTKLIAPLFQKAQVLPVNSPAPFPPALPSISFSARCMACNLVFDSIASLEKHNATFHNNRVKLEEHKKIIALFEDDEEEEPQRESQQEAKKKTKTCKLDGIVDVLNI